MWRIIIQIKEIRQMKTRKFKTVAEEWLEFHRAKVKYNTYLMYQRFVFKLIDEFENRKLSDITPLEIQKLLNNLQVIGYAKSTISKYRLTLQLIYKYGIQNDDVNKNCCSDTYVPKDAKVKKVGCVSNNDIKKILESYKKPFGFFAFILLTFGLRKSEALALTWEDIDIDNGYISINKIIEYHKSEPMICNCLKNGDDERIVPILPMTRFIITEMKENQTGIIFAHNDTYMHRSRSEKEWQKYLHITGLEFNKHQLRHTYATLLYKAGVDMKTAMMLLGHKDIAMLMKIYTHTDVEMLSLSVMHLSSYMERQFSIK